MTVEGCDLPINTFLYTIILEIIMKRLQQCMFSGVGVQNPSASLSADGLGYFSSNFRLLWSKTFPPPIPC